MKNHCPQCKEAIDGIASRTYAVGWCEVDVHVACLPLHVRSCPRCRRHNEGYLLHQEPVSIRKKETRS